MAGVTAAGNTWRRFASKLVVIELATALVLLAGAGLLGRSLYRLLQVDVGFQPEHLATVQVALPASYAKDEQQVAATRQIISRLSALPGVTSVGVTTRVPVSSNGNTTWIRIVGHPYGGEHNEVNEREVSAQFFQTLQARLIRGRFFNDAEDASKPNVVVINQALAKSTSRGRSHRQADRRQQALAQIACRSHWYRGRRQGRFSRGRDLACRLLSIQSRTR